MSTIIRHVVIITEEEKELLSNSEIGETEMIYNPILDKNGNWTLSQEEVQMSKEPFLYLKERAQVLFEEEEITPWW
jgi:hypothetical protein